METAMTDALETLREDVRDALDLLAQDFAVRVDAEPGFDADVYFVALRRTVEARAVTLKLVREDGPMGGGGPNEA
jgi:hypothetical protein